jgi:hypothetical protein
MGARGFMASVFAAAASRVARLIYTRQMPVAEVTPAPRTVFANCVQTSATVILSDACGFARRFRDQAVRPAGFAAGRDTYGPGVLLYELLTGTLQVTLLGGKDEQRSQAGGNAGAPRTSPAAIQRPD